MTKQPTNKYERGALLENTSPGGGKYVSGSLLQAVDRNKLEQPSEYRRLATESSDVFRQAARQAPQQVPQQAPQAPVQQQPIDTLDLGLQPEVGGRTPISTRESFVPERIDTTETIRTAEPPSLLQRAKEIALRPFTRSPEEQQARDNVVYNITKKTGLDQQFVDKRLDEITKELGIREVPTTMEALEMGFTVAVSGGLATAPIKTLSGLTRFLLIDKSVKEALNIAKSLSTDQEYKPGRLRDVSDVLPESINQRTQTFVDFLFFLGEAYLTGKSYGLTSKLSDALTKNILTKYNLPKSVKISGDKIKSIFQTGEKISAEEAALISKLGMNAKQYKAAIKNGVEIEIPAEVIVTMVDKPYWARMKEVIGVKPIDKVVKTERLGEERVAPSGLLEKGKTDIRPVPVGEPITKQETKRPTKRASLLEAGKDVKTIAKERVQALVDKGRARVAAQKKKKVVIKKAPVKRTEVPAERKIEAPKAPEGIQEGEAASAFRLRDRMVKEFKEGKEQSHFAELHNKLYAEYLEGKTKTDKSEVVSRFIDENFRVKEDQNYYASNAQSIDRYEKRGVKKDTREKLHEAGYRILKKYAANVSEKYVPRGAEGVHFTTTSNIALKSAGDIPTVIHESAHAIDVKNNLSENVLRDGDKTILKALKSVYTKMYPGARKNPSKKLYATEGFATLVERYIAEPTKIKSEYPELVEQIIKPNGKYNNEKINSLIKESEDVIEAYQGYDSLDKFKARVIHSDKRKTDKKSFYNLFDKTRTELFDSSWNLEKAAIESGVHFTKDDPSLWLRQYNRVLNVFNHNVSNKKGGYFSMDKKGEFVKTLDYNWNNFVAKLKEKGLEEDYGAYLVARRVFHDNAKYEALRLAGKNKEAGELLEVLKRDDIPFEDAQEVFTQNKEKFKEFDELYDQLVLEDLKLLANPLVRIIGKEEFAEYKKDKGYASFKRELLDEFADVHSYDGPKIKTPSVTSTIKRKGSKKPIVNPVLSAVKNHGEVLRKATRQIVYNKLMDISKDGILKDVLQEIPVQGVPIGDGIMFPQAKDPSIFFARDKAGKKKAFVIHEDLKKVFDVAFDTRSMDIFSRMLKASARMFTKGTTGFYLPFALTNLTVDSISAMAQTRNKLVPMLSMAEQIRKVLFTKERGEIKGYIDEFFLMGGHFQTFTRMIDRTPNEVFKSMTKELDAMGKAKTVLEKAESIISAPAQGSELVNRLAEYIKGRQVGKHQIIALEEAGRVTASFHHYGRLGGKTGRDFLRGFSYLNAGLQVLHSQIRAAKDPVTRSRAITLMFMLAALSAGGVVANIIKERQLEKTTDKKEKAKLEELLNIKKGMSTYELGNYVYYVTDDNKFLRLRIPGNYNFIGSFANMALTEMFLGVDYKVGEYIEAQQDLLLPQQMQLPVNKQGAKNLLASWIPMLIKPEVMTMFGHKDFPDVKPVEPDYFKYLPSEERVYAHTNDMAKFLGKKFNISPILVENWMKMRFGRTLATVTEDLSNVKNWLNNQIDKVKSPFQKIVYPFSGRVYNEFYEEKDRVDNKYRAEKNKDNKNRKDLYNSVSGIISDLKKINRGGTAIPREYQNSITGIAELLNADQYDSAVEKYKEFKIGGARQFIRENKKK